MLDLHAIGGTPGAGATLGNIFATIPANDGASQAGVPIDPGATLKMWGGISPFADTIAALQLLSQDQLDQQNGEYENPGTTSLLSLIHQWTNLKYSKGLRQIYMGTNTGVTASGAYTIDDYSNISGAVINASVVQGMQVTPPSIAFSGSLTPGAWGSLAYAPTKNLPNGKYAILGVGVTGITNAALIRFQHTDFKGLSPGFPVMAEGLSLAATLQVVSRDAFFMQNENQFVYISKALNEACCPVFSVGNNTTGLQIQMYDLQADTPSVRLALAQVSS